MKSLETHVLADPVGDRLRRRREALGMTRAMVVKQIRASDLYYSAIEDSMCPPPGPDLLRTLMRVLEVSDPEAKDIERQARIEREQFAADEHLPEEALQLIADIRKYANVVPPRFLKRLRKYLTEVLD